MGNIFSIRLTDEDKVHLQQRMDETGKNATEVFKSAIYFTEIDADLVDEIISNIGFMRIDLMYIFILQFVQYRFKHRICFIFNGNLSGRCL